MSSSIVRNYILNVRNTALYLFEKAFEKKIKEGHWIAIMTESEYRLLDKREFSEIGKILGEVEITPEKLVFSFSGHKIVQKGDKILYFFENLQADITEIEEEVVLYPLNYEYEALEKGKQSAKNLANLLALLFQKTIIIPYCKKPEIKSLDRINLSMIISAEMGLYPQALGLA